MEFVEPNKQQQVIESISPEQAERLSFWVNECIRLAHENREDARLLSATLIVDPFPEGTVQSAAGMNGLIPYASSPGRLMGTGYDRTQSTGRPLQHSVMEAVAEVAAKERTKRKEIDDRIAAGEDLPKSTAYLCTTYDVFTFREPCIMCAMGLVHSRVNRVFVVKMFEDLAEETRRSAGYSGEVKVHALSGTNHRYRVYRCIEDKDGGEIAGGESNGVDC